MSTPIDDAIDDLLVELRANGHPEITVGGVQRQLSVFNAYVSEPVPGQPFTKRLWHGTGSTIGNAIAMAAVEVMKEDLRRAVPTT